MEVAMREEDAIKKQITDRLKLSNKFHHYCCVCGEYLYAGTQFFKYTVHYDCRNQRTKYYNSPDNPPKPTK